MKRWLYIFCVLTPCVAWGQYTHFNTEVPNPYPDIGSGVSTNLFVFEDEIKTFGIFPAPYLDSWAVERRIYGVDYSGSLLGGVGYLTDNYGSYTVNYGKPFEPLENIGYMFGCGYVNADMEIQKLHPAVFFLKEDFELDSMWVVNNYT